MPRNVAQPRGSTRGQSRFSRIEGPRIQRSLFDRSHGRKQTFNSGLMVPFYVDEVLPGDTFRARVTSVVRMATPIHPLMDNLFVDFFFFCVPLRLLWSNFERFMGAQDKPSDSTDYLVPKLNINAGTYESSLADYFGIPKPSTAGAPVNALPFRAYNLVMKEFFRDQDLEDSPRVELGDSGDTKEDYPLWRRAKRRDYFSAARPRRQKGTPVELPFNIDQNGPTWTTPTGPTSPGVAMVFDPTTANLALQTAPGTGPAVNFGDNLGFSIDVNGLRDAVQVQRMLERDSRGGTRYPEVVNNHFGVRMPEQQWRPTYLGGGSTRMNVTPVAQTVDGGPVRPLGTLAGYGLTSGQAGFTQSFVEHGIVIGMVNVRADVTYQNGLDRMWSRTDRYSYFWPTLQHLGEQEIKAREVFLRGGTPAAGEDDDKTWGYQERYAEYRYKPSTVAGEFRSTAPQPLDSWHLALNLDQNTELNQTFIQDNPPMSRVLAVQDGPEFIGDFYIDLRCARPMAIYATPGNLDRF